ncbi:hypothetical protein [Streptomyces sp. 2P-4]|uniref:hypothetical protein n=1 Tax=Streptomyces sp. 2P-4 TaxID=2931974 RepID=UPI00254008CB|nr:hypothetical protein [Streptomyces sp. 2P-4]
MADELHPEQQVGMRLNGEGPLAPGVTAPPPPLLQQPQPGTARPPLLATGTNPPPPLLQAPGGQDFASTPAEKKAAANTIETELQPNTKKAANDADESTAAAQKGFDGWETAAGLKKVAETWDQQVKNLIARLEAEKGALRGASGLFTRNDIGLRNDFLAGKSGLNGL